MHFEQLGLSEQVLKSLKDEGYKTPTLIQSKAIPAILDGQDVMAAAQTGTGKTAAFTLPILDKLSQNEKAQSFSARALVLVPTRELAAQVLDSVHTYGKYLTLSSAAVFGGVKIGPQINHLRKGVDILVATPGRLLDLISQRSVRFDQLEILVLDEADRMLDMGFINDIKKIISLLPKKRQTLLFSATFSQEIRLLAKGLMHKMIEVSVTPANSTVKTVKQVAHPVDKKNKNALLSHLIWENKWEQVLVFTRTKWGANKLADYLVADGMEAVAIHGNKSQGARTRALKAFKEGEARVLVATDIAARGLDIELLPHVVNFDLPQIAEDYVHRIGRTGRAGASGEAVTLLSADEAKQLAEIERLIKQKIERKVIEGFEPNHVVPETRVTVVKEPKKFVRTDGPQKSSRFGRGERTERTERTGRDDRFQKSDRPGRFDKTERTSRFGKPERFERSERSVRGDRTERTERTERKGRDDRSQKSDRPGRFDKTERTSRFGKPERFERSERSVRGDRAESTERTGRADRPQKSDRADRFDRTDRIEKSKRPSKGRSFSSGSKEGNRFNDFSSDKKRPSRSKFRK